MILRAIGYEPTEIDPAGMCCGASGVYSLLRPDTSTKRGRRKAEQIPADRARLVASANPGCEMQLRNHVDWDYRLSHPVEINVGAIAATAEQAWRGGPPSARSRRDHTHRKDGSTTGALDTAGWPLTL